MSMAPGRPPAGAAPSPTLVDMDLLFQEPALDAGAALVAALLAVDPQGLGGVRLRGPATEMRSAWLKYLRALLPSTTPWERLPVQASDTAVLGGLDLAATLATGRAVAQPGLLARAHGGMVLLGMAERVPTGMAAHLAAVLDQGEIHLAREGLSERRAARVALLALDEGQDEGEALPPSLCDRLAFSLELDANQYPDAPASAAQKQDTSPTWQRSDIEAARARLPRVNYSPQTVEALCGTALLLGVDSLRGPLLALRVARAAAALTGEMQVDDSHTALAAKLVLAPRATRMPQAAEEPQPSEDKEDQTPSDNKAQDEQPEPKADEAAEEKDEAPEDPSEDKPEDAPSPEDVQQALQEMVVEAALAAIPPGLLAALKAGEAKAQAARGGRAGAAEKNQRRGRPVGARRGEPRAGARLHVLDTLRAAAPWQKLRRAALTSLPDSPAAQPVAGSTRPRILVRREDFHVRRFKQNRPTTTLFVVDASGSSALHRLAEAKGAVELLLADCYVRRDRVAVISFGGGAAQLLLPPTRSLARAKRSLSALPGGGGTPLAAGMDAARELAVQIARQGETPVVVLLTDGRANIARDGKPGRAQAGLDALQAAREFRLAGLSALLIDTSPQAQSQAQGQQPAPALAQAMGATYLPLPFAGAKGLNQAVRLAGGVSSSNSRSR